jgi:hypothetical protein
VDHSLAVKIQMNMCCLQGPGNHVDP